MDIGELSSRVEKIKSELYEIKPPLNRKLFNSIASEIPWWDDNKQNSIFRILSSEWKTTFKTDMEAFILDYIDQEEIE